MEVSDPESISCGMLKSESPQHPPEKPLDSHLNSSSTKQNSYFSLTIDEFQYKSGKSLGSMNMDELLNNVWNVEANQVSSNDENPATTPTINNIFPPQASFSIPTVLSNKTVEDVWSEIRRNQAPPPPPNRSSINGSGGSDNFPEHQQTFGEITLEDFLIKVGVIQEASGLCDQEPCLDHPCGGHGAMMMGVEFFRPSGGNNFPGGGGGSLVYHQVFTPNGGSFLGESSNDGNEKCEGVGRAAEPPHVKRRTANGCVELAVERRQRRMIKNRESAARSRARKQAYTAELEIELNQLREENARLKLVLVNVDIS
ncbi:hypothetical protein U1Q18_032813 [Sarracenia purpurea var. burkii]